MEPHATIAAWRDDHLTLWSKSQFLVAEAAEIAAVFDLPVDNVLVINPFIGGAFRATLRPVPHASLATLAARYVRRSRRLGFARRPVLTPSVFPSHTEP